MRLLFGGPRLPAWVGALALACGATESGSPSGAGGMAGTAGSAGTSAGAGTSGDAGEGGANGDAGAGGDAGANPLGLAIEQVATWRGAALGAYTIIHDDICDYTLDSLFDVAEPELSARGLRAGFGAIVQRCVERDLWVELEALRSNGHEIVCHSWDHPYLTDIAADPAIQIDQATATLDANLVGQATSFFIFPFDDFNDSLVARLETVGYLGARAGAKGLNPPNFPDGMRVMFDVYGGENSIYDGQGDILKLYVDLAISEGGWANREFHGIADTSFFAISLLDYTAHLDYVKSKVDQRELWMDTPTAVVKYRFAREHCGPPTLSGSSIRFGTPSALCTTYSTPLSVIVTAEAATLHAEQGGEPLVVEELAPNRYVVDILPNGEPATFSE
jgi:Polysaccharide deacetylase